MASGRDQLDEPESADGPEPAGGPAPRPRSRVAWHTGVVLVFALAGALFLTARDTADGQGDIRPDRGAQLSDVIRAQNTHNQQLTEQVAGQRADQDALTRGQSADARVKAVQDQVDALAAPVALTPVSGSALAVTLNDAPPNAQPAAGAPTAQPDWLIIHQQDVQAVVNALWAGGATGIQLMDQRLAPTSAVRCVGNTLLLQGRVYSPPYVITAVGDTAKLRSSLLAAPAVQTYLEYVSAYGLGWDVKARDRVTLPGYTGPLDVSFASVAP
ncbi:protein of unknown function DUF881 [Catenulispora acidiphila DSM 44928]|uniref:Membrane spanning protein DUF881 n=1 Tax=Catenulispora acidiphila (strain DSM 44928 / JCM 14897 / NBRC 102108 / NRRL B-24433 / ID139908) TaxID=479433 RepID=C7QFQ8_CATAD|nr:DUF881 domain-containing protein [Catenulispora acidiphila]ACU68997.1 protein of unknown function DUF881 [Catenulispora acidiphila DSM 44928]